jgi:hypothetical protein
VATVERLAGEIPDFGMLKLDFLLLFVRSGGYPAGRSALAAEQDSLQEEILSAHDEGFENARSHIPCFCHQEWRRCVPLLLLLFGLSMSCCFLFCSFNFVLFVDGTRVIPEVFQTSPLGKCRPVHAFFFFDASIFLLLTFL